MSSSKSKNIRRENHFVPKGLLRQWFWADQNLRGYWWDIRHSTLQLKERGLNGFCFQLDLLTTHTKEGMSDQLERDFEAIDTPGCVARDRLLTNGAYSLSAQQRCDFARLLMSLEVRRPKNVGKFKSVVQDLRRKIDCDPEILEAFHNEDLSGSPAAWFDRESADGYLDERSFEEVLRRVVDHSATGLRLLNASWHVIKLGVNDGTLVLSDRPSELSKGVFSNCAGWVWALPLTPKSLFVATNDQGVLDEINSVSRRRLGMRVNTSSVARAEKFIFAADGSHGHWVGKYLSRADGINRDSSQQLFAQRDGWSGGCPSGGV